MVQSVLGPLGKRKVFGNPHDIRVGTPDPTQYHDTSQVTMEGTGRNVATLMPSDHGFAGLRGTIIPRATKEGASRGYNHLAQHKVVVDLGPNNGSVVVDMAKLGEQREELAKVLQANAQQCDEFADAALATYYQFAEREHNGQGYEITVQKGQQTSPANEDRQAPLQMPGVYVVPKATQGGGQVKSASFLPQPVLPPPVSSPPPPASGPSSLRGQFEQTGVPLAERLVEVQRVVQPAPQKPARKVTFELPRAGQFTAHYHDIVRQGLSLVLVYDHNNPVYSHYVPPVLENESGDPEAMAVLVHAAPGDPERLYLVYFTGLRFTYRNEEFFVLVVEKEKTTTEPVQR